MGSTPSKRFVEEWFGATKRRCHVDMWILVKMLLTSCRRSQPTVFPPARLLLCGLVACFGSSAAEVDISRLPPPANRKVDFVQDVQPILARSCVDCHGPT